jgi:micrococcal nuclease
VRLAYAAAYMAGVLAANGCSLLPSTSGTAPDSMPPAVQPATDADTQQADDRPNSVPAHAQPAVVTRNVDGDTLWVRIVGSSADPFALPVGEEVKIRVLLIDSPETVAPGRDVECGGPEASAYTKNMAAAGSPVWLTSDVEPVDPYGRALRYVWTADGELLGELLVAAGLADVLHIAPNGEWLDVHRAAYARAAAAGVGIHGQLCPAG